MYDRGDSLWYFGIKSEYVDLCKSLGTRTNCLNDSPMNSWGHKYMFKGLSVITGRDGSVLTAFWFSDEPNIIKDLKKEYEEILLKRNEKLARHSQP